MNFKFKSWLFNQLPEVLREADTYPDPLGKGLLERYLENIGEELDNELVDFIQNFTDILGINTMPDKLLVYLGYTLGSPPSIDGTHATYRKLLRHLVSIYKVKGTICSYQLLFNLLGLGVIIYEYPTQGANYYDTGLTYDAEDEVLYDMSCEPCNFYDILYYSLLDDCSIPLINPVPPELLENLEAIICFIQPIDAKLLNISQLVNYCEEMIIDGDNEVTITISEDVTYDAGLLYDTGLEYDGTLAPAINIYTF